MTPPPPAFCCSAHALRAGYRSISAARAGAQQQTSRTPLQLSIDGTDRQTDGRTPDRNVNRPQMSLIAAYSLKKQDSITPIPSEEMIVHFTVQT